MPRMQLEFMAEGCEERCSLLIHGSKYEEGWDLLKIEARCPHGKPVKLTAAKVKRPPQDRRETVPAPLPEDTTKPPPRRQRAR